MPASFTRAQNGSKQGSPSERRFAPGHRRRAQVHHARVARERPLELRHRLLHVHQREHGRREDPLAPGEAPVLVEPLVEGVQRGVGQLRVVAQRMLDADAEGRKEQAALDPLLVHQREPRLAVAIGGADRLELAEGRADVESLGILAAEEARPGSRPWRPGRRSDSG